VDSETAAPIVLQRLGLGAGGSILSVNAVAKAEPYQSISGWCSHRFIKRENSRMIGYLTFWNVSLAG
jgi:hypothetical protein